VRTWTRPPSAKYFAPPAGGIAGFKHSGDNLATCVPPLTRGIVAIQVVNQVAKLIEFALGYIDDRIHLWES
jgi:hypothetical protein